MRNLNECQVEVFRRSEKRIKERKRRRNHILMACIPLALCITVFGAFILPNMDGFKQAPESADDLHYSAMGENETASLFAGYVEVSGNGISNYYTSAEDVQGIITLLNQIVSAPEKSDEEEIENAATNEDSSTDLEENYGDMGYRILIKRGDGTSAEYLLAGSMLIDQATQERFHMSEDTYFDLKDALGIPFY